MLEEWDGRNVPVLVSVMPLGGDLFENHHNQVNGNGFLFGGQVLGQSLAAAAATVGSRPLHSMHGYFLRPGRVERPVRYAVERTRDGRSFSTRRVTGLQDDAVIFHLDCSFHEPEPGWEHQMAIAEVPPPERLASVPIGIPPDRSDLEGQLRMRGVADGMLEVRPVEPEQRFGQPGLNRRQLWLRVPSAAGHDDPALHASILAWLSDHTIGVSAVMEHVGSDPLPRLFGASIDHAMWFHRPVRVDDWLLFDTDSPSAGGGIGLSRGLIHDRAGRLVATVAQETLQRWLAPPERPPTLSPDP